MYFMRNQIIDAIKNQNLISLYYDGGIREVEPYCFGVSRQGNILLRVYQISGYSNSNKLGWKLLSFENIKTIEILKGKFENIRIEYKKGDKAMTSIFCEI